MSERSPNGTTIKFCNWCGKKFLAKHKKARWCSASCKAKGFRKRHSGYDKHGNKTISSTDWPELDEILDKFGLKIFGAVYEDQKIAQEEAKAAIQKLYISRAEVLEMISEEADLPKNHDDLDMARLIGQTEIQRELRQKLGADHE